ncbi:2-amino-4-hydroxy-6-hydroxymethyldihydropteridine diphosphokinase [Kineococcus sp. SYSU DK003]|uniref:2-amino-4-hydroxy-6- hydroxymethyldihydropteridine diphosphokinase n=1 Tax=Kineococcus sp. SYSU DK003 TaxID=3383124 RepID=UPI003D7D36EF
MTGAVLALGANLGHRAATLRAAVDALQATEGVTVEATSTIVETAPVGAVPDQPDFLNAVVLVTTSLDPHALLAACHAVEAGLGLDRSTKVPDGPRPVDVDVITYGELVLDRDGLVLPHPRAHERAFVLGPWLDLDPDAVLPGPHGGRVADLLRAVQA